MSIIFLVQNYHHETLWFESYTTSPSDEHTEFMKELFPVRVREKTTCRQNPPLKEVVEKFRELITLLMNRSGCGKELLSSRVGLVGSFLQVNVLNLYRLDQRVQLYQ